MATQLPTEPTGEQLTGSTSIRYDPSEDGFHTPATVAIDIARDRRQLMLRTETGKLRFDIVDLRGRVVKPMESDAPYAYRKWVVAALDYVAFHMEDV